MTLNKRVVLISATISIVIVSFFLGIYVGKVTKRYKKNRNNLVKFYQTKKAGQELTEQEKKNLESFVLPYETCILNTLDKQEKLKMLNFQKEIIDLAKDNTKIKFKISNIESAKNEKHIIKKIKQCQKQTYKNMKKENIKAFKNAIKKMKLVDIITLFHGVK